MITMMNHSTLSTYKGVQRSRTAQSLFRRSRKTLLNLVESSFCHANASKCCIATSIFAAAFFVATPATDGRRQFGPGIRPATKTVHRTPREASLFPVGFALKPSPILRECHVRSGSICFYLFGRENPEKIPVIFGVQRCRSPGVGCGSKVIQSAPLRNQCRKDSTCVTWR